jgi:hypothetical protein
MEQGLTGGANHPGAFLGGRRMEQGLALLASVLRLANLGHPIKPVERWALLEVGGLLKRVRGLCAGIVGFRAAHERRGGSATNALRLQ